MIITSGGRGGEEREERAAPANGRALNVVSRRSCHLDGHEPSVTKSRSRVDRKDDFRRRARFPKISRVSVSFFFFIFLTPSFIAVAVIRSRSCGSVGECYCARRRRSALHTWRPVDVTVIARSSARGKIREIENDRAAHGCARAVVIVRSDL